MALNAVASALHISVYNDQQESVSRLLSESSPEQAIPALTEQDKHGNSVFHIAAILGHSTILSELFTYYLQNGAGVSERVYPFNSPSKSSQISGSPHATSSTSNSSGFSSSDSPTTNKSATPPAEYVSLLGRLYGICVNKLFNHDRWSPFEEAVARGHRPTISIFIRLINIFQVAVALESSQRLKQATKEKVLQKHDFSLKMKFDLRSWIPFISRFLPNDEITLHHRDGCFRLDFHIMPGDGEPGQMLWKIGNHSVIFNKSEGQKYAVALDHKKRRGEWIITEHEGRKTPEQKKPSRSSEVAKTLEALYECRSTVESWVCANNEAPEVPVILNDVFHIDNAEVSRQINMFMSKPIARPGLSTHNVKFSAPTKFLGMGGARSSTFGEFKADNYTLNGLELVVRSRNEHLSEEDRARHNKFKVLNNEFKTGKKYRAPPQVQGPEAEMFDQEPEPEMKEEDITARLEDMDKLLSNCMNERRADIMPETDYTRPSYEQYLALNQIKAQLGHGRQISSKIKRHPVKGKISLCDEFPIQKDSLLNMISAAAPRFRHFKRLEEFLKIKMPSGFPVNLDFPIWATVSAQLVVLDLKLYKKDAGQNPLTSEMFSVPKNYVVIDKALEEDS